MATSLEATSAHPSVCCLRNVQVASDVRNVHTQKQSTHSFVGEQLSGPLQLRLAMATVTTETRVPMQAAC